MLKVYAADWCPHCVRTIKWLGENNIEFDYIKIDEAGPEVMKKIIEVNGGHDWVIPTMEYSGKWRPGKTFDPEILKSDLREMGINIE